MNNFYILVVLIAVINVAYIICSSVFLIRLFRDNNRSIINFMNMQIETNREIQRQIAYLNLMCGVAKYETRKAKHEAETISL
jgi:hypothetical protein